jgi:hypothetical protein
MAEDRLTEQQARLQTILGDFSGQGPHRDSRTAEQRARARRRERALAFLFGHLPLEQVPPFGQIRATWEGDSPVLTYDGTVYVAEEGFALAAADGTTTKYVRGEQAEAA